ncbi:hypothetical protein ACQY0O_000924 [Thecaphora frezii]|nr:putative cytoplasmic protein [Thecaphora frezii]
MPFAQLVIGSPGSGKSTYCHGLSQFLPLLGRPFSIVNLDPANDGLAYPCALDINHLISVRDVMAEFGLGPNAAMLYCIEYLEKNIDWLLDQLRILIQHQRSGKLVYTLPATANANATTTDADDSTTSTVNDAPSSSSRRQVRQIDPVPAGSEYFIFDLPGQVELSTNHPSLRRILTTLEKQLQLRCVAVHMTDATHITDPSRYVSLLLLALRAMLALELPHVNVLSKVDLLGHNSHNAQLDPIAADDEDDGGGGFGGGAGGLTNDLAFNLDFYTQVQDLSYLYELLLRPPTDDGDGDDEGVDQDDDGAASAPVSRRNPRFAELNRTICDLVEDFGLVQFETLAVEDRRSMFRLLRIVDKAVGYVYLGHDEAWSPDHEDDDEDDGVEGGEERSGRGGRFEPGSAKATAARAGASAAALFGTADRGVPVGWGDALEVQERYVDHREAYDEYEAAQQKQRQDEAWEKKVWDQVTKVTKAEGASKQR